MSALRLAAVLVAAAAALSTGAVATPGANRPLLTFAIDSDLIPLGLCATDLNGHMFRLSDPRQDYSESWSPDGRFLAFIRRTNDSYSDNHYQDLVIADARGRIVRTLSRWGRTSFGNVRWSPDGKQFAGVSGALSSTWLWVMNTDGTGRHIVFQGNASQPSWSPDGTKLLFSGGTSGAAYVVDADGGNLRRLVDSAAEPVWSPDGREFAYLVTGAHGESIGLAVAAADGSDRRVLIEGDVWEPAWSPDGTTIAFQREDQSIDRIELINRDGTNAHTIAQGVRPVWSPDGDTIAFVHEGERQPSRLGVVKTDGTGRRWVYTGLPGTATLSPAWRRFAPLPPTRRPCVVRGSAGSNRLRGTKRGDVLFGGAGDDTIDGAGGRDVLVGGAGHDRLSGGPGNDFLAAKDATRDRLFGGPGWDRGNRDHSDRVVSVERQG